MQPRWLVTQLEELDYQTEYQTDISASLVSLHQQQQSLSNDNLSLAKSDAFATQEIRQRLIQKYDQQRRHSINLHQQSEQCAMHCQQQQSNSESSLNNSEQLLIHWQKQKQMAQNEVSTSEQKVHQSESRLAQSESSLRDAKSAEERAYQALKIAEARPPTVKRTGGTDEHPTYTSYPPDTSYERSALRSARSHTSSCQQACQQATQNLHRAHQDLKQAKAHYQATVNAVKHSQTGVELAQQGCETANLAQQQANQALEQAQAQLQNIEKMALLLNFLEEQEARQSHTLHLIGQTFNDSHILLKELEAQQEAMQGEAFNLKYTLQDKMSLLIAFDQALMLS